MSISLRQDKGLAERQGRRKDALSRRYPAFERGPTHAHAAKIAFRERLANR